MPDPPAASFSAADTALMHDALALAQQAVGLCDPNPRVGCVIAGGRRPRDRAAATRSRPAPRTPR